MYLFLYTFLLPSHNPIPNPQTALLWLFLMAYGICINAYIVSFYFFLFFPRLVSSFQLPTSQYLHVTYTLRMRTYYIYRDLICFKMRSVSYSRVIAKNNWGCILEHQTLWLSPIYAYAYAEETDRVRLNFALSVRRMMLLELNFFSNRGI